jgi:hypothetical protein
VVDETEVGHRWSLRDSGMKLMCSFSFSPTLQGLHDQLTAHKRGRETMQASLKEKYGAFWSCCGSWHRVELTKQRWNLWSWSRLGRPMS